jgi:hypothetical protein
MDSFAVHFEWLPCHCGRPLVEPVGSRTISPEFRQDRHHPAAASA